MNVVVLIIKILEWMLIQLAELYVLLEQLSDCLGMQPSALDIVLYSTLSRDIIQWY
jgi:hypothetical protein